MRTDNRPLRLLILVLAVALAAVLSACSGDQQANLAAEATAALDEATAIAQTVTARTTEVAAIAAAAATQVYQLDGVNQQLAVTMRAAIPPTDQVVFNSAPVTPGLNAPLPGQWTPTPVAVADAGQSPPGTTPAPGAQNQITAAGPALAVRDSDGCAVAIQSSIPVSSPRIYATTRILNATAGTSVQAAWSSGGQVVFSNTPYMLPADDPDFCVWFYIEPADVNFAPGDWSLQFLVNGQPTGAPTAFTLTG